MRKQPLSILCVCFTAGIVIQEFFPANSINYAYFLLFLSGIGSLLGFTRNLLFIRLRNYFLGLFFFSFGLFLHFQNSAKPEIPKIKGLESIIFKLDKKLNSNSKNKRYEVTVLSDSVHFRAVLSIPKAHEEIDFKHYYKAEAYMNMLEHPKNDYQFDYAQFLHRKGIYYQGFVRSDYQRTERKAISFSEKIKQQRLNILQKIDRTEISARSSAFMKGIILADRTEMDSKTITDFTRTGLIHILAISGTHIVIIFGFIFLLLKKLMPLKFQKHAVILSLIFIWFFAVFIDYGNPVVRSCIMISVYYIYILLQRKADMLHSMSLAAFIILLHDSHQFFNIGFQLSFIAVLGIYWLNQPILTHLPKSGNKIHVMMTNIVSITFAAQIATLPLVLFYFHQFSFISFFANMLIIPLAEIIIIFSMFLTILIGFGINFTWINNIYDLFISKVLELIHWFSGAEMFFSKNIPFSLLEVLIIIITVYFLRFLILKFSLKNILNVSYCLLIFFTIRFSLHYFHQNNDEVVIHHYFREKYFSAKENGKVTFWLKEGTDQEKIQHYIIHPYLQSRRTKHFEIKKLPSSTETIHYKGQGYDLSVQ